MARRAIAGEDVKITFTFGLGPIRDRLKEMASVDARIPKMIRRSKHLRPWFELVLIPALFEMEKQLFRTNGVSGLVGVLWEQEYSKLYRKWKRKTVGHLRKERLGFDGTKTSQYLLQDSLLRKTSYTILKVRAEEVTFGSRATNSRGYIYVGTQQEGADTKKGTGAYKRTNARGQRVDSPWHRKRSRKSEDRIAARPPVIVAQPPGWNDRLQDSLTNYIVDGRYDRIM